LPCGHAAGFQVSAVGVGRRIQARFTQWLTRRQFQLYITQPGEC
jgi:hypothetical protein